MLAVNVTANHRYEVDICFEHVLSRSHYVLTGRLSHQEDGGVITSQTSD